MKNRVYGVIGIKSVMANWNADFTGRPKSTGNGDIYGSDKALKFSMKKMWETEGEDVIYIRSYILKDKLQPKELKERYKDLFDNSETTKQMLLNLFSAIDVMNFGATFAIPNEKKANGKGKKKGEDTNAEQEDEKEASANNISITGAVQIGQGFNKYKNSNIEVQDILSPFKNPNEKSKNSTMTSIGTKIMSDEAHYFYPFAVNPENYKNYIGIVEGFDGYTKEAYEKFKTASLVAATAYNTNSKMGCENEFGLFVELKENSKCYLPDLAQYVVFEKGEVINTIDITGLNFVEKFNNEIEKIEIYYNPYTTQLKTNLNCEKINILTKEGI